MGAVRDFGPDVEVLTSAWMNEEETGMARYNCRACGFRRSGSVERPVGMSAMWKHHEGGCGHDRLGTCRNGFFRLQRDYGQTIDSGLSTKVAAAM